MPKTTFTAAALPIPKKVGARVAADKLVRLTTGHTSHRLSAAEGRALAAEILAAADAADRLAAAGRARE